MRPSPWGDEHAFGVKVYAVALPIEAGNRLAQLRQATGGGVAGMPCGQGRLAGGNDGGGGGEVRLADLQVNHVVAGGLQFVGTGQQGHDVEGFDGATARTVWLSHGPSLNWV